MSTSDRLARMSLCCTMDGGDPAVADLIGNLGAQGAWAKISEGMLGEPAAQRAMALSVEAIELGAAAAAIRPGR